MISSHSTRPPVWPYAALCVAWLFGSILLARSAALTLANNAAPHATFHGMSLRIPLLLALSLVTLAECVALFFLLGFVAKSISYLALGPSRSRDDPGSRGSGEQPPRSVVVLYLTAGDFDPIAVDSLLCLEGKGRRLFVIHDDGNDEAMRQRMAAFLERHPARKTWEVSLWHRPERVGGKAGAVNWVLERLAPEWELLLLCDSDSIGLDSGALVSSEAEFDQPDVAVVQFRNAGYAEPDELPLQRRLANAIDVFDVFATPQARWGYLPFFGHNALVRVADLRALGGLTPGFFSDDLDFSVRLTLAGRRIVYRSDIVFGERHPPDFATFRKRSRKWAFGCMQVGRARLLSILATPRVPFAQRIGLVEFIGFYPAQALLVLGLLVGYLLVPWLGTLPSANPTLVLAGSLVLLALFAPTLAWSVRQRTLRDWPALAWSCALVYGGSILATTRGVLDGLSRRPRPWIPTNLAERRSAIPRVAWAECVLGLALAVVPWLLHSPSLAFPASYLFIAIFLFSPLTFASYYDPRPGRSVSDRVRSPLGAVGLRGVVGGTLALFFFVLPAQALVHVDSKGGKVWFEGRPYVVRGIQYSPWLPGAGPDGNSSYPGPDVVERDLRAIGRTGANTLMLQDAPGWVIDRVRARGLLVIYAFHISWQDTSRAAFDTQADRIVAAIDTLRTHDGVWAWILGNEVPPWVVEKLGSATVTGRIRDLAMRVRAIDPGRLLGHANWPPTKDLDLSFLDLACFNLYPTWPYEVAVRGFGPYLREVLAPLAHGRPLLLTEFGINSLEAGEERQARVLQDCWREIVAGPAVGGVVLEWSDEWWKNFDNPIPGKGYWERAYAPDDAARHDQDPEEYYGIVRADRSPKPAFSAVCRMWRPGMPAMSMIPWVVLIALALFTWVLFRGSRPRAGKRERTARVAISALLLALLGVVSSGASTLAAGWTRGDTLTGERANDEFGWAVTSGGDLNGDGLGDVAIGARYFLVETDSAAGAVYVFLGGQAPEAPAWVRLDGLNGNEHFGESLTAGRDVNGDGRPDLVVGAPLRTVGSRNAAGAVDVFLGGPACRTSVGRPSAEKLPTIGLVSR